MENILQSFQSLKSVLIMDDDNVIGLPVLKSFIFKFLTLNKNIFLYKFENNHFSSLSLNKNLFVNDLLPNLSSSKIFQLPEFPDIQSNSIIIIDCLSPLIFSKGTTKTCHYMKNICDKSNNNVFITNIHKDLHKQSDIEAIKYYADLTIDLISTTNMTIFHCRISNKINNKFYSTKTKFQITKDFVIKDYIESPVKKSISNESQIDPASNLTFNLKLKIDEEEAKRNLVLPYIAAKDIKSSKIEYIPDQRDDIDEEDPDEDLDI